MTKSSQKSEVSGKFVRAKTGKLAVRSAKSGKFLSTKGPAASKRSERVLADAASEHSELLERLAKR